MTIFCDFPIINSEFAPINGNNHYIVPIICMINVISLLCKITLTTH